MTHEQGCGIRLHGTPAECAETLRRIRTVMEVTKVSEPYPDRGGGQVRVYVEARLGDRER